MSEGRDEEQQLLVRLDEVGIGDQFLDCLLRIQLHDGLEPFRNIFNIYRHQCSVSTIYRKMSARDKGRTLEEIQQSMTQMLSKDNRHKLCLKWKQRTYYMNTLNYLSRETFSSISSELVPDLQRIYAFNEQILEAYRFRLYSGRAAFTFMLVSFELHRCPI